MLSNQFDNVLDLGASRKVKKATGQAKAIKKTAPESASFEKHANQAIGMTQPKKRSMTNKALQFLGFVD